MKIKYKRHLKNGNTHVLIELLPNEPMPIAPINDDAYYRLNYPHEEIVCGHHIKNPQRVYWDTLGQKWEEA